MTKAIFTKRKRSCGKTDNGMDQGRHSFSNYASSIVIIPKKDNTFRICIDYRQLNSRIVKDRYPLPLIEDQLDKLREAMIFTTLDLENEFFHIPMDEEW